MSKKLGIGILGLAIGLTLLISYCVISSSHAQSGRVIADFKEYKSGTIIPVNGTKGINYWSYGDGKLDNVTAGALGGVSCALVNYYTGTAFGFAVNDPKKNASTPIAGSWFQADIEIVKFAPTGYGIIYFQANSYICGIGINPDGSAQIELNHTENGAFYGTTWTWSVPFLGAKNFTQNVWHTIRCTTLNANDFKITFDGKEFALLTPTASSTAAYFTTGGVKNTPQSFHPIVMMTQGVRQIVIDGSGCSSWGTMAISNVISG